MLRPWVAAYSLRAPGTIFRSVTSTMGSPVPATCQLVEPSGSLSTPQSFETKRPKSGSNATEVAGKSGKAVAPEPSRLVQVASPRPPFAVGLYVTEKTCPGVAGVIVL